MHKQAIRLGDPQTNTNRGGEVQFLICLESLDLQLERKPQLQGTHLWPHWRGESPQKNSRRWALPLNQKKRNLSSNMLHSIY